MNISLSRFLQRRTNIYLYQNLGWQYALSYIRFLGRLYFFFNKSEGRKIKNAVRTVFAGMKNRSELRAVACRVFQGVFSHYYEKVFNVYASVTTADTFYRTHIKDQGLKAIRTGLSKGRGVLLVTGHYGGVEFIPGYLSVNDIPVSIVVNFSTDQLREITLEKCKTFSTKIIDAQKTPNIMSEICSDLKKNRVVVTQCDEIDEWRPSPKDKISFLGIPTFLDRTINILIKRGRAETVFGLMHRDDDHRYRFIAVPGKEAAERMQDEGKISLGAAALKFLERYILEYPQEWYQWKQYSTIPTPALPNYLPEHPVPVPLLGSTAI